MRKHGSVVTTEKMVSITDNPRVLQMDGHELSIEDCKRVKHAYWLWYNLWLDVSERLLWIIKDPEVRHMYSRICSPGSYKFILRKLPDYDVIDIVNDLKAGLQALRHLSDNERSNYCWYERQKPSDQLRNYVKAFDVSTVGIVWKLIQPFFLYLWITDDYRVFGYLNDILQFPVRLTLLDTNWVEEENIQEYLDFEEKIKTNEYSRSTLKELQDIVSGWFSDFNIRNNTADHGYGATSEVKRSAGTDAKYHKMIPTVETALLTHSVDWVPSSIAWPRLMPEMDQLFDTYQATGRGLTASNLVCKVQLVPKAWNKKRVVSMEPTVHQFYQKIIGSAMSNHFDRHPFMKIDLHDQEINRKLALEASQNHRYGTIDLSSASDSVTRTLVRALFCKSPLYDPLFQCRTTAAVINGTEFVALEKFAPMGSAVCFPTECTVFSAIVSLASRRKGVHRHYAVYGDDIICHRDVFEEVIKILEELNFKVNLDKSFEPDLPFKESCGIEAYKGYDVSPIRISRKYDIVKARKAGSALKDLKMLRPGHTRRTKGEYGQKNISPQLYCMYDLGNAAFKKGYLRLRRAVIQDANDIFVSPVFSHNFEHGFFTPATNLSFNCEVKVDPDLQNIFCKCLVLVSRIDKGPSISRYSKLIEEYGNTRRSRLLFPEDRIEAYAGAAKTMYSWEWLPWDVLNGASSVLSTDGTTILTTSDLCHHDKTESGDYTIY